MMPKPRQADLESRHALVTGGKPAIFYKEKVETGDSK